MVMVAPLFSVTVTAVCAALVSDAVRESLRDVHYLADDGTALTWRLCRR